MDDFDIRLSDERDAASISRLAALGGAEAPQGSVLLAELDGEAVAAIGSRTAAPSLMPVAQAARCSRCSGSGAGRRGRSSRCSGR